MTYDLANPLHCRLASELIKSLSEKGKDVVEIKVRRPKRTLRQNAYLHLILSFFASQHGCTTEYVKQRYFKLLVNPQSFVVEREDKFLGKIKILRSSSDLNTEEMTLCIERFRNWSASEAGIYIPSADEHHLHVYMQNEIERAVGFM